MMPENTWRRVRSESNPETGERTVLLSGVFEGVRLWCEKHWSKPHPETSERDLLHERFFCENPQDPKSKSTAHSTVQGAYRDATEQKWNEEQLAQLDPEKIP